MKSINKSRKIVWPIIDENRSRFMIFNQKTNQYEKDTKTKNEKSKRK